jgi:hypothetical protein
LIHATTRNILAVGNPASVETLTYVTRPIVSLYIHSVSSSYHVNANNNAGIVWCGSNVSRIIIGQFSDFVDWWWQLASKWAGVGDCANRRLQLTIDTVFNHMLLKAI